MSVVLVVAVDDVGAWHLQRAVAVYVAHLGRDVAPRCLTEIVSAISGQQQPVAATTIDTVAPVDQAALMSHSQAAEHLGVSRRTVGRLVATGKLTVVGRLVTRRSVKHMLTTAPAPGDLQAGRARS